MAGGVAGARAAGGQPAAGRGLCGQSRRRRPRRLRLSAGRDRADGGEFRRRRRRHQPDLRRLRPRPQGLRPRARPSDRRHRGRAGAGGGGLRRHHGLRHGGDRRRSIFSASARWGSATRRSRRRSTPRCSADGRRNGSGRDRRRRGRDCAQTRCRHGRSRPSRRPSRRSARGAPAPRRPRDRRHGRRDPRRAHEPRAGDRRRLRRHRRGSRVVRSRCGRRCDHCLFGHVSAEPGHAARWSRWASDRCSISGCGSARAPAPRSPRGSSRPPSASIPGWLRLPRLASPTASRPRADEIRRSSSSRCTHRRRHAAWRTAPQPRRASSPRCGY